VRALGTAKNQSRFTILSDMHKVASLNACKAYIIYHYFITDSYKITSLAARDHKCIEQNYANS